MIRIAIAALIICVSISASAQTTDGKKAVQPSGEEVYTTVDQQPAFPGDLMRYLSEKIYYPQAARDSNIQGRVVVRFIVDEKGAIISPEIVRSAGAVLDYEALRVIGAMPLWTPGSINGVPVKSYFNLPVSFKLQ